MKFLKKYPYFLFLLPLFFCLHVVVENTGLLKFNAILQVWFYTSIGLLILCILLKWLLKNWNVATIVCFYVAIWYLFFGAIQDGLKAISSNFWLLKYSILIPFLFFTTILLAYFLRKKKIDINKLYLFFNFLLIVYCIVDTTLIIKNSFNNKNTVIPKTIGIDPNLVKAKPSIYFMLFDGYPGYKSLSDSFSFKNDSLYSFLKQNNFKIESSFSNYNLTYYSMASIFNLNYVKSNTGYNEITMTDLKQRYDDIKNADLFNILDSLGYSIKNYSLFDLKNNPGVGYSFSLNIGTTQLLTDKMLHSRFIKNIGWVFITGKYSIPFIKNRYKDASNQYNKKVEDSLTNCLVERNTKPKFVYMHFIMPHWPYYYDKNGVLDKTASLYDETPNNNKNKFIGYLKYTNIKMEQCVKKILLQDSNAVIITMSDHGFREYTGIETNKSNAVFDNFCAIRFSGNNNHLKKDSLSNVNIFRYLLNTEFNQKMNFLPDSSFFLEFKTNVEKIKE